jgi:D-alanyl-D-alanine carboxypeptidase (penicillin-binding protein 5/6)
MKIGSLAPLLCAAVLGLLAPPPAQATAQPQTPTSPTQAAAQPRTPTRPAQATVKSRTPTVPARAAYLADEEGGVFAKRATSRMPVASLTKVMTAYVVLREARLRDTVTITAADVGHAARNGATHASLRKGERLTVRDLLYAVMLPSGADASHALARKYGPGDTRFVAKMNAAARRLKLADTRYTNPDGLPLPSGGGYSTARDQVRLARIVLDDPIMRTIAAARRHVVGKTAVHHAHTWRNTNKLLGQAPGAIGLKTGYTRAAGYCLLFAANRDGRLLVGAVLGDLQSERRFSTAERLLDWADRTAL